ncbi:MAG: dipicolinate synthase subunit DpsA [Oscillospiraceae bacterium]|nr:dipicolinate synthase subunit DpsA [Oscillospiraceae bacterium]
MKKIHQIAVCGGDRRQSCLAEALFRAGYPVAVWGRGDLREEIPVLPIDLLLRQCDCFILPLPCTVDGKTLFAPDSAIPLLIKTGLAVHLQGKTVFAGKKERLAQADPRWNAVHCLDYSTEESFAIRNAFATVEGALAVAISSSERTLWGSRCLVTGYGRIGRVLCQRLSALGAQVWASARRKEALTWIESEGYHVLTLEEASECSDFDFVFNTIPAPVFSASAMAKISPETTLIELASEPGGFAQHPAGDGHPVVKALSLPGRFSPQTAGEILKETILTMLEE